MSSVSNYSPGGYIAKFTQSVAEDAAKRKKQNQALAEGGTPTADTETTADAAANDASAASGADTADGTAADAGTTLEDFKKSFQKNVRSLTLNRHFIQTKISLDIDDAGYEKMMADPAYEQKVMGKIREKMGTALTAAPAGVSVKVDGKGEKIEAVADAAPGTSLLGLTSTAGKTPTNVRSSTHLDALTNQVSAVLSYRLGSDPAGAAKALLNRQA